MCEKKNRKCRTASLWCLLGMINSHNSNIADNLPYDDLVLRNSSLY